MYPLFHHRKQEIRGLALRKEEGAARADRDGGGAGDGTAVVATRVIPRRHRCGMRMRRMIRGLSSMRCPK